MSKHTLDSQNYIQSIYSLEKLYVTDGGEAQVEERKVDGEYTFEGHIFQEPCLVFVEVEVQS